MTFLQKLETAITKNNSLLCIGLDPEKEKIPSHLRTVDEPQFAFNKAIINATFDTVCCYKPNAAFYEAEGADGVAQLKSTADYVKRAYPDIPIILDGKRGDIGNTMSAYARFAFDYLGVDALTVNPYLGKEALLPILERADKGCIVVCRTSNPGAAEFQDLSVEGTALYEVVARQVANKWNKNGNCLLVVGATYSEELKRVRQIAPKMTFLVPGIGVQGGDLQSTLSCGLRADRAGLILAVGRSVIYAGEGEEFAKAVRIEAQRLKAEINNHR